jgi:ribonuclease G
VLQWFRKKVRAGTVPHPDAPQSEAEGERAESRPEAPAAAEAAKPRRRRGTRGGRGRKKTTAESASAAKAEPAAESEGESARRHPPKEQPQRAKRRRAPTRRTAPSRARPALPDVKKEILVSVEVGEQRVAVLEDGKPAEVYLERPGRRSIAGNVYKGVVDNVLPGMEASFVEIGLERNGFLYVDEIVVPELEGRRHGRKIQDLIQRGEEVLVQAVKDPMGTKGARLTTEISLPGRFLVYTPFGEGIGISRRLDDAERERLKAISKELEVPEGGVIVRTAAEGASKEELEGDLALLQKLWSTIKGRAGRAEAPALVYQEAELPLRIIRDLFIRDFERVVVDHERTHRRIVGYLKRTSKDLAARVELYTGKEPLMEKHGVADGIRSTLDRRVDLPSGGYLIFDYAEAFTVIDVNTGRFVGSRGKASAGRLEDTITKNNLEAVEEVVRQLRLRDIGGIIVIDFIDMANPKNRELVEEALKRELERDRTKTYVVEISPLGLVEMTRQNVTDGPREILTLPCTVCGGDGVVVSDETHAVEAERKLRRLVASSRNQAFRVELSSRVAGILIGPGASRLAELERETGRRFFFETRDDLPADHFEVLAKGPVARLEAKSLPVSPGDELDVRLEEVHLQNERDAIARLNGYVVAVAGGGGRVGENVKVRIERATRTVAYAVLADGDGAEPPVEAGTELERDMDEEAPEPAPKKRTRRGSRGGRGRKKKTDVEGVATDSDADVPEPAEPEPVAAEPDAPEPVGAGLDPTESERDGSEAEKPRKKTRRGTRGGRRRRKRPAEEAVDLGEASETSLVTSGEQ